MPCSRRCHYAIRVVAKGCELPCFGKFLRFARALDLVLNH